MAQTAALGEAKVSIRASFEALQGDLDNAAKMVERTFSSAGRVMRNTGAAITAGLSVPLAGIIAKSTMAAARVQEMAHVNLLLGDMAGYSATEVRGHTQAIIDNGIEAAAANETISDFIRSNLDIADASRVARIAQDAAVISGQNSTEVTRQLTMAIVTGRMQLFKSAGVLVDLTDAYDRFGESIGKSGRDLTEQEKLQARVNATIEYGTRIAGAYEKAMEQPGKVLRSYPRYLNEIFVAMGQWFLPAFKTAVDAGAEFLQTIRDMIAEGGGLSSALKTWGENAALAAKGFAGVLKWITDLDPAILNSTLRFAGMLAVMGPVLLVGGQMMIWVSNLTKALGAMASALHISRAALLGAAAPMGLVVGTLAVGAAGMVVWNESLKENERVALKQGDALVRSSKTYGEYLSAVQNANRTTETGTTVMNTWQEGLMAGAATANKMSEAVDAVSQSEFNYFKMAEMLGDAIELRTENFEDFKTVLEEVADNIDEAELATARLNTVIGGSLVPNSEKYKETMTKLGAELLITKSRMESLIGLQRNGLLDEEGEAELASLITKYGDLQDQIDQVATEHEQATARIIFGILAQQIALMGLPFEDTMALLGGVAEAWGLVDDATAGVWDRTTELLQSYLDGKISVNEFITAMERIKDRTVKIGMEYSWWGDAGPGPAGGYTLTGTSVGASGQEPIHQWNYAGGPVSAEDYSWVGERGIELYKPASAGAILSNHALRNLGSSQNNSTDSISPELLMALGRLPTANDIALAVRDAMLMVN